MERICSCHGSHFREKEKNLAYLHRQKAMSLHRIMKECSLHRDSTVYSTPPTPSSTSSLVVALRRVMMTSARRASSPYLKSASRSPRGDFSIFVYPDVNLEQ